MNPGISVAPETRSRTIPLSRGPLTHICAPLALALSLLSFVASPAQVQPEITEPKLLSIFPLGGQRGTTIQVEVRGNILAGATDVWTDGGGLQCRLLKVEVLNEVPNSKLMKANEKVPVVYQVSMEVQIQASALPGLHLLRLVTPRGVSDGVPFRVFDEPITVETASPHTEITHAQAVTIPAVINGKLAKPGELDYYSFQARRGEELSFEVISSQNCDPRLALYHAGGSWFDPARPTRLLLHSDLAPDLIQLRAHSTYRFTEDGQYYLEVSSIFGKGSPGSTYQVRIHSIPQASGAAQLAAPSELPSGAWLERSFARKLQSQWMEKIQNRSIKQTDEQVVPVKNSGVMNSGADIDAATGQKSARESNPHACWSSISEVEPNDGAAQSQEFSIPGIIQGAIEKPGDIDCFKFNVGDGQSLAFELETPDTLPPYFNPRLGVVDAQDRELFSNVERRLSMFNNNADPQVYLKSVSPKAIYTFEHGGTYFLQIRDITSRYGDPSYRYKILVRPEIPHLGEVSILEGDHINLVRGESKKLTITAAYEEGFNGDVTFAFAGLPEGVRAFPAVQYDDGRAPLEVTQKPEIIAPSEQKTTLVLVVEPEALLTSKPKMVQLRCRPIVKGKMGSDLLVREIPLMVVENAPSQTAEAAKPLK